MKERLFKRKIYTQLLNWKQESDGKSALFVEGAWCTARATSWRRSTLLDKRKCALDIIK